MFRTVGSHEKLSKSLDEIISNSQKCFGYVLVCLFIYLSFTGNSVVRQGRDAYATTFGKKNIQRLHTQTNVFNST